jgi:hypothetical protein
MQAKRRVGLAIAIAWAFVMAGVDAPVAQDLSQTQTNRAEGSSAWPAAPVDQPRPIILISDLHLGLGRQPNGSWSPKEDFRWSGALAGFLEEISAWSRDRVDLVIVGDFLELWQPPAGVVCNGPTDDIGCTLAEAVQIVEYVVDAHPRDLALIRDFANRGENRVIIVLLRNKRRALMGSYNVRDRDYWTLPGNHDASLLLPEVWAPLGRALGADTGRVVLANSGLWTSADGTVVTEHGHQIGSDVNRYSSWPQITIERGRTIYVERSWGELFVQRLFNREEKNYPIIDNVFPLSMGAKYRLADRGFQKSAADLARFIAFNLFENSVAQKVASLGPDDGKAGDDEIR